MVYLFYTTSISVELAHHEIFHAKVGKDGIRNLTCSRGISRITPTNSLQLHLKHMVHVARKPDFVACELQRHRPTRTSMHSDQHFCN